MSESEYIGLVRILVSTDETSFIVRVWGYSVLDSCHRITQALKPGYEMTILSWSDRTTDWAHTSCI